MPYIVLVVDVWEMGFNNSLDTGGLISSKVPEGNSEYYTNIYNIIYIVLSPYLSNEHGLNSSAQCMCIDV